LAAKKKTRKKMTTLQLSKQLSVRQLAAIIKRLSREDKDKFMYLIWNYVFEVPKEVEARYDEWLKKVEADPSRMIPLEESMRRLRENRK